ncbi:MAG: rRNA methyltransferase, partial [Breznakiellaceae bacterium]
MDLLLRVIEKALPLPARFKEELPRHVAELSALLTRDRSEREGGYLGRPHLQSAYLRYFLPWNVFRLVKLLSALPLSFQEEDTII